MRDSFDTYFTGWNLDPEEPAEDQARFAVLVEAVGRYVNSDPTAVADWRAFPLDGKKECFFHFVKKAKAAGALPASVQPLIDKLKAEYPRTFAGVN